MPKVFSKNQKIKVIEYGGKQNAMEPLSQAGDYIQTVVKKLLKVA